MSHFSAGLISAYNSLTDKHLAGYFSNTRIRRHLQRAGLITRSGRIVPDKEYRHKLIQRAHQRHVRECLAQAIFHKVLEMERLHQIEIKRKLEEFARRERVRKIKVERSKRYEEGFVHILSPRPPTGARGIWKQHSGPEGEHSESSESPSSSRPNTAPGKMQRPVRLKPIHSNSTTASLRRSSPYRPLESSHENDVPFNCTMEKEPRRRLTPVEPSHGISPYCLPVINNFVTPVPPATKRKERGLKVTPSSTVRGRRLHPTTASSGADDTPVLRSSVHQSRVCVNMVYFGKTVRLSSDLTDMRDEVKVFQQHCGGENLCVYKGKLHEGETFQFISRRHRGFPFSLTFFLNGLQVERLSSCCEFKHRKGSRLGGKHGHFGFSSVEGAAPCYKCIIAMGLDKKPTPPPKRVKEDTRREESVSSPKNAPEMETERTGEDVGSHSECETSQPQETPVKEETAPEEDKDRDDYEEDFEADEEKPAEEEKEEKSPSPSSEMESQVKEKDASDTENDEKDDDTRSHSGSSSSGSEQDESDAEDTKDSKEDQKAEQPREDGQEETVAQPMEKDEPNPEEAAATEAESSVAKDSHMDSAGDSTEIEISDTSVPSGSDTRQSDDKDAEKMIEESKHEEEQERAKSVQEKLAEAILKEAQCSSEPELSDTSTEEEEETTHKGPQQDNKAVAPDELVTITEQQETIAEETKCEESDTGEVVVAQEQEDSPETKEQSDNEQEPHENRDGTEDEKAEEDEATADKDKSEETGEALHLLKEENVAQDDKRTEPVEEIPAETIDAETVEKDEEKEEKTAVETDVQCDEAGQGAKSREEDESSVSEPDERTDETAVPDNAGEETMTARETIEIKAEPSEEREALSYEEAPVTDAEKREPADSEDGAAASETEVTAENSSSSPNGSGETTVEKVADTSEENTKDESSKDDIKEEQVSGKETSKDDSQEEQCEQGEEGMETEEKEDKQKSEEDGEEEKEKQTRASSDEIEEDESTEKRENDEKDEEPVTPDIQENTAESADNATKTKENEEETVKILGEDDKVSDEEKVEESEKTENDETSECVENEQEDLEAREADKNEGGAETETKTAVQEHNHEAEKSESENENKAEKSEDKEIKNDEEDDKEKDTNENPPGEGISATAEESEKSADVGVNETADGTKFTEDTPEFESVEQEAGRASNTSEKGETDAENGEVSTGAESKTHDDEGEAQPKDENDLKTTEHGEEGSKSDRPAEDESADIKELTMESEESAKKHEDDEADQAPGADEVERDAKEGGDSVEKNDESSPSNSQPETAGAEIKEEPKLDESEETEEDQNGNKSDCGNENKEPYFIKKESSIEGNMDEVTVVASGDQEQSSAPVAVELSDTASKLDEENKDAMSDIHPHTENAVGVDLPATDGENGVDAEDASKTSEEGASVLLKPQAQNDEADNTEQSAAAGQGNPETLGTEDNTDLVTNWVNKHQSSKFFETFVEPLEDLREEVAETPASNSNKEETKSTELPRSESPLKMVRMSDDEEKAHTDIENVPQVEEKTDMKGLIPKAGTEQSEESAASQEMRSEERKGSKGDVGSPQECNDQKSAKQGINEETEVESISGSHHLAAGKPESVSKNQTDEKTTDTDLNVKQPQTEEGHQSTSPLGTEDINETWGKADKQDREVTETTDLTTSKSDDGSQEELRNEGVDSDRKELQLIEDIKHTLSKDQLSTFSVDETLLAHSSYPLLTAARAESGH
ncbi:glutamate-rich protein 3 [Archocentrus centrarchus]|uniref:glutamate-rich protein 3 n=1 Tax=Archocentrus centrarchus TaxID=63155 RepID=UPI0011E9F84F|nr:glutamate-rich protein 3 [Archocentrus centrarchus]